MKCSALVAAAIAVCPLVHAQNSDQLFERVERKLLVDHAYSRLCCMALLPADLTDHGALERALVTAGEGAAIAAAAREGRIILHFLHEEDAEGASVVPVMAVDVRPPHDGDDGLYRRTTAPPDTVIVVHFRQFITLMRSNRPLYDTVCSFLLARPDRMEKEVAIRRVLREGHGSFSRDNSDYAAYAGLNGTHAFMKSGTLRGQEQLFALRSDSARDSRVQGEGGSAMPWSMPAAEPSYTLDVSFSRISFSHQVLTDPQVLGLPGFGFEAGFGDRVLNLLAYQSPYLAVGVWGIVGLSADSAPAQDRDFFEFKALWRAPLNTPAFIERLGLRQQRPFFGLSEPGINVTGGMAFEINLKRPAPQLPYINLYVSFGGRDFDDPYVTRIFRGTEYGYWSPSQWEASLAWYFNTDAAAHNRFRLDLGAGSYNVHRVGYGASGRPLSDEIVRPITLVQPLMALEYTYSSARKATLFGLRLRFFDNRLTVLPWLKVLRIGAHELRIENAAITAPVGRSREPWETGGADVLQFRYRYGL